MKTYVDREKLPLQDNYDVAVTIKLSRGKYNLKELTTSASHIFKKYEDGV